MFGSVIEAGVAHIVGLDITIGDRFMRQRCAWCGALLTDYDLANVAMMVTPEDPNPRPSFWPAGAVVVHDGNMWYVVELDDGKLPDNCCGVLNPAVTV